VSGHLYRAVFASLRWRASALEYWQ
jgi:hypothetical protein